MLQYVVGVSVSGGPSQWPVTDTTDTQEISAPVSGQTVGRHSESSDDHNSDISLHCSY